MVNPFAFGWWESRLVGILLMGLRIPMYESWMLVLFARDVGQENYLVFGLVLVPCVVRIVIVIFTSLIVDRQLWRSVDRNETTKSLRGQVENLVRMSIRPKRSSLTGVRFPSQLAARTRAVPGCPVITEMKCQWAARAH